MNITIDRQLILDAYDEFQLLITSPVPSVRSSAMERLNSILSDILATNPVESDGFKRDIKDYLPITGNDTERIGRHRLAHVNANARIRQQKEAIIEILDMLAQHGKEYAKLQGFSKMIRMQLEYRAEDLKAKLVGDK